MSQPFVWKAEFFTEEDLVYIDAECCHLPTYAESLTEVVNSKCPEAWTGLGNPDADYRIFVIAYCRGGVDAQNGVLEIFGVTREELIQ